MNHADSLFAQAATLLRHSNGVPSKKYLQLLEAAYLAGSQLASTKLALFDLYGWRNSRGVVIARRNVRRGVQRLQRAAKAGCSEAFLPLGACYSEGLGVRKDEREEARWYRRAYAAGESAGAYNLSRIYFVRGDRRGQRRWLRRAADAGDVDAVLDLSELDLHAKSHASRERARLRLGWLVSTAREECYRERAARLLRDA